jgi:hypothetical protein
MPAVDELSRWLLADVGFRPTSKIELTWDANKRMPKSPEAAFWWWRKLLKHLNHMMLANTPGPGPRDYRRRWGHSYFSYVAACEYQKNSNAHLHVLVDEWVNYWEIHQFWNDSCGFAWKISKWLRDTF